MTKKIKLSQKEYDEYHKLTKDKLQISLDDNDDWQIFWHGLSIKYKFNPILSSISNTGHINIDTNPFYNDMPDNKILNEKIKEFKKKIKLIKEKRELYAKQKRRRVKQLQIQERPIPDHLWVRAKDYQ